MAACTLALAVIAAVSLRLTVFSSDGGSPPTVLSVISGDVRVQRAGDSEATPAADGESLKPGDRIITGSDGRAVITFFEGSTQTLEPGTDLTIKRLDSGAGGGLLSHISQATGRTWNNVFKTSEFGSDFSVDTPAAAAAVRDTMFLVEVADGGLTDIWTRQGSVTISGQGVEQIARAGNRGITSAGSAPEPPAPVPPSGGDILIEMTSEAWLLARNPEGFSSGLVPPGAPVNQIPLAVINNYDREPQLVALTSLMDTYDPFITYTGEADFRISVAGISLGNEVCTLSQAGSVGKDEILKAELRLDVEGGMLLGCELTEAVVTDERPYDRIVLPEALLDHVLNGQGLIPEIGVLAATVAPATATGTPPAIATATPLTRSVAPATRSVVPAPAAVNTPAPAATATQLPLPTATQPPARTNTPPPGATNVPPPSTKTPVPAATSTPAPTATATATTPCAPGVTDVNNDGVVSTADIDLVQSWSGFTVPPAPPQYDVNGSGTVTISDVQLVAAYLGVTLCP